VEEKMTLKQLQDMLERQRKITRCLEEIGHGVGADLWHLSVRQERILWVAIKDAEAEEARLDQDLIEMERRHREWEKARV
jgi:hypothetical protein